MLENLKKELIAVAKDAQLNGLCKHKSGNFSVIDRSKNYVLVTPSGIDRLALKPEHICVLDLEGNIVEALAKVKPSSETMMHLMMYQVRQDIQAIIHTHSKFATTFAVLAKPIPAIVYEVSSFGLKEGYVPVAPFATPGTRELATNIVEPVQKADMILLERHGSVTCGKDLADAYLKAQYLEELCEIYYRALVLNQGKEPRSFSLAELEAWQYPESLNIDN